MITFQEAQFLELLGIKESEPFEDELMQLLGG